MPRPRRRRRPLHTAVLVIAVLHLLGAFFGFCLFGFQAGGLREQLQEVERRRLQQENPGVLIVFEDEMNPEQRTLERVGMWADAAFTVMVLVAGVGLLLRQNWARWLSVAFAALSIPVKIAEAVAAVGYAAMMEGELLNPDDVAVQLAANLFRLGLGLVYATVVLVVMLLPSVARSLRRERVPTYLFEDDFDDFDADDYDAEDYPRYRRRR